MAVQLNVQYGQWLNDAGRQLSIKTPGLIVFNGAKQEVYLDGKVFGMSQEGLQTLLQRVSTLEAFRKALYVAEYKQAEITTSENASALTIFGIKQGTENDDANNGQIAKGTEETLTINIDGVYNAETNKIATVKTVNDLRTEIFGTLDPEELEKTIDTIKEIQAVLIEGAWKVTGPDGEVPATHVTLKEETTIGTTTYPEGAQVWTDGTDPVTGATVYASQETPTSEIVYTTGYSELTKTEGLDQMLDDIKTNTQDIKNINNADLVTVVEVADKDFVTVEKTEGTAEDKTSTYAIGVQYGEFKTGHGEVMDPTVGARKDGIATVEDVQRYIEERMTWVSYETSSDVVAENINSLSTGREAVDLTVSNDIELNNPLVIK